MKKLLTAFAVAGLAAAPALAQTADWKTTDANTDSMGTMEEATAAGYTWTEEQFKAADTDGNGSLSEAEFTAAIAKK